MRPPSHWPKTPQTVSRFTAVAWPRGLDVTTAGSARRSLELDAEMLRIRAGWPLPALQSRVTAEYGLISIDDFTSGVRIAPHRSSTRVTFATNDDATLRLPTRILGWGFVANSTIAAILLLVPIALFRLGTPRASRGKSGRAAACWFVAIVALGTVASVLVAGGLWLRWQTWGSPRALVTLSRDANGFFVSGQSVSTEAGTPWPARPREEWDIGTEPARWSDLGFFPGVRASSYYERKPAYLPSYDSISLRERTFASTVSVGWPMRCMESVEFVFGSFSREPARFCFEVNGLTPPARSEEVGRVSPTRPYWLGLVANTLFYAYLIALPLLSIRAVRVVRRRRRGACESCGYSRAGIDASAACPECGAAFTARS